MPPFMSLAPDPAGMLLKPRGVETGPGVWTYRPFPERSRCTRSPRNAHGRSPQNRVGLVSLKPFGLVEVPAIDARKRLGGRGAARRVRQGRRPTRWVAKNPSETVSAVAAART
jgi:hypothetical protein